MSEDDLIVRPEDIRVSYMEFPEPHRETHTNMAGEQYEIVKRGAARIEWDSPEGTFVTLEAITDEDTLQIYADKHMLACVVARTYAEAKRAES